MDIKLIDRAMVNRLITKTSIQGDGLVKNCIAKSIHMVAEKGQRHFYVQVVLTYRSYRLIYQSSVYTEVAILYESYSGESTID